jgi:hypothetical protein
MARPRIAVFGVHKTGTTALWTKIRDSLPWQPRPLFEPGRYDPDPEDRVQGVLAKVMVVPAGADLPQVEYDGFVEFERKVVIRRDPRDWLVSVVLFALQRTPLFWDDQARLDPVLADLRRKEADPRSVDTMSLFETVYCEGQGRSFEEGLAAATSRFEFLLEFEERLTGHLTVRYEDFVDDRYGDLSEYLGVEIAPGAAIVDAEYRHVPRTCAHGNWRDWLTPHDVDVLRPLLGPYMERCGYSDDWELAAEPSIPAQFGSGYVERVVTLRRRRHSPTAPLAW